ncbi:MAG: hypothetical protein KDB07_02760, partial [Planctomycetes bacterium]|nr:hypothetical protein [Planctomycetota bacterium]
MTPPNQGPNNKPNGPDKRPMAGPNGQQAPRPKGFKFLIFMAAMMAMIAMLMMGGFSGQPTELLADQFENKWRDGDIATANVEVPSSNGGVVRI